MSPEVITDTPLWSGAGTSACENGGFWLVGPSQGVSQVTVPSTVNMVGRDFGGPAASALVW